MGSLVLPPFIGFLSSQGDGPISGSKTKDSRNTFFPAESTSCRCSVVHEEYSAIVSVSVARIRSITGLAHRTGEDSSQGPKTRP